MSELPKLVAGNWKMHKTLSEARALAHEIVRGLNPKGQTEVVLAPPFTALAAVAQELRGSPVKLAGQDTFWEEKGPFTGAISPVMLKDVGCTYVIIGHSERRQHFGETDQTVNRKVKAALAAGLIPIVCVGETLRERESGRTLEVVATQVREGLAGFPPDSPLVLAYEPVWAIGTGRTATPEQAQEVHAYIRTLLPDLVGEAAVRILYGGSVTPENAKMLLNQPDVDGALVGGASLKGESFLAIIAAASG
jgi:triosephosphate isomerase|uniref:Triosephosphate isomerase n=1 Tax=Desulfobacca acetoxidans TaxID=60893 RepID=A0A7C5ENR3_9BACT